MCGIVGAFTINPMIDMEQCLPAALDALHHRGPDDRGLEVFFVGKGRLFLGHTRLSIIDLSPGGHQPMRSVGGRYTIVFNGEIYNYRELRQEMQMLGYSFHTESDTEVLLTCWAHWGTDCLPKLVGMFAFAVFDSEVKTLTCVRDAFGIKPLFYKLDADGIQFASEVPALLTLATPTPRMNDKSAYDYLVKGLYDDKVDTFFQGVQHLLPGHFMVIDLSALAVEATKLGGSSTQFTYNRWWWPSIQERTDLSFSQAAEQLREMFLTNIRLHLRSDVPLGAALSGGIDSSAVVCAMRHLEPDLPIHTFTFVAHGSSVDEEKWADLVNHHVGAIAHKVNVRPEELAADMDDLIRAQGEPFGSTSIYAQYRVFKLAKELGITVTLDGQGADEMLAGYNGYPDSRMRSLIERGEWRDLLQFVLGWSAWPGRGLRQGLRSAVLQALPNGLLTTLRGFRRHRLPPWINTKMVVDEKALYNRNLSPESDSFVNTDAHGRQLANTLRNALTGQGLNALLRHGDRNAMRWNIESRVPFLTHDMAEFLLTLPEHYLISQKGETKHIFRAAMRGIVPDLILDRKDKVGFATPEQHWLKAINDDIKNWTKAAAQIPLFRTIELDQTIEEAIYGKTKFGFQSWRILNYCRWVSLMQQ